MKLPFRARSWDPPAAVIDIRVGGPVDSSQLLRPCEALVDPGADMTALPAHLVEELGLPQVWSVVVDRGGMAGQEEEVFSARVDVPLLGESTIQVLLIHDSFAPLGRDILNRLTLVFDGPSAELELIR